MTTPDDNWAQSGYDAAMPFASPTPKSILVCQLRQIGDVVLATPSIELLARQYPDAAIDVLTLTHCAPVLAHNPHVRHVHKLDKKALSHLGKELAWYWQVAAFGDGNSGGYDLVVDFQQLPRIRWVVLFAMLQGCATRITHTAPWYNRWLYTHTVRLKGGYAAMCKASTLEPLGIRWNGEPPRIYLTDEERAWVQTFCAQHTIDPSAPIITVDPTHRRDTRRWPAHHWASLLDSLAAEHPALRFILLYGPGEAELVADIRTRMNTPEAVIIPNSVTTLREMAAIIDAARLHLGNCSAPSHFAAALDTPSLIVRGATSDAWRYPSDEHREARHPMECMPCNQNSCARGDIACLESLEPAVVLEQVMEMLS